MFDQKSVLVFLHILALVVALGGSIYQVFILPPLPSRDKSDLKRGLKVTAQAIGMFSPINFGMVAVIVFTGVLLLFNLNNKISNISSPLYLNIFSIKILLVVVIFSIAAYQTFNLRFKIVTMNIEKEDGKSVPKPFRVMRTCSKINIVLTIIAILLGVTMSGLT